MVSVWQSDSLPISSQKRIFYLSHFMCHEYLWWLCADTGAWTMGEEMLEITPCELVSLNIQCILLGHLSFIHSNMELHELVVIFAF
jgi:hypothetical protein